MIFTVEFLYYFERCFLIGDVNGLVIVRGEVHFQGAFPLLGVIGVFFFFFFFFLMFRHAMLSSANMFVDECLTWLGSS